MLTWVSAFLQIQINFRIKGQAWAHVWDWFQDNCKEPVGYGVNTGVWKGSGQIYLPVRICLKVCGVYPALNQDSKLNDMFL